MRPIKNPDIDMPADPFAETQPDLASNATRIRDIVCIVENFDPHPDEDSEQGDDYGHCHECKAVIELEPGDEWTPFCNDCAHAIVEELARAVQEQRIAIRRAESERDAQHEQVLRLTAEWDEARVQLRAANDFLRVVTLERDHAQQVEVPDAFWRLDEKQRKVAELTATRDLLTAENERLQQEHNAYCRKLANDGLTVAGRLQRELDAVRAENDTLHYLLRGGQ